MFDARIEQFNSAVRMRKESTEIMIDYWKDFSIYTSFEYWMLVGLFIAPLIVLIWKIDKSKIFLIGFFGYGVHVLSFYISLYGVNRGLWNYPIQLIPAMPSFAFDASLVPVTFMLAYQWTLNSKKNFYIVTGIISIFFSFIVIPILVKMEIFKMYGEINYFHQFIAYMVIVIFSKQITNVFIWLQKKYYKA